MCNFLSAIVLRNGDVLSHPSLDSHSDLVTYFQLPDTSPHHQYFAKVELTPTTDWLDPSTWAFRLDEETAPGWWADVATTAEQTLRDRAAKMILRSGTVPLLCDGVWILGGDVRVGRVCAGARILRVQDHARITAVVGGAITDVWGGTITDVRGGAITDVRGGTITNVGGGTITDVWGGAITDVWGGTIADVGGGTKILLCDSHGRRATLDDSARAHLVKSIEQAVRS